MPVGDTTNDRVTELEQGLQMAIDYLEAQPMLTPDEESLMECLQTILDDKDI